MTVAPEVIEEHRPIIKLLRAFGVVISIGHSVASYEQVKRATDFASAVTHWLNAMTIDKRRRGLFTAAIELDELSVMIIADGIHFVLEDWIPILLSRKSHKKVILTSDAVPPSGLSDGVYPSIGGEKVLLKDGKVTQADDPEVIAGSALQLNIGVRNLAEFCPLHTAVAMATINPLRLIGLNAYAGSIETGKFADLAIVNAADFSVMATIINGRIAYRRHLF
jgi:N-acetylglucosamine-6-phosphate deacetylase